MDFKDAKFHLKIAQTMVQLLDNQFKVLGFRFGLDPVMGVVPVIGDVIPLVISLYLVWIAIKMGLDEDKIAKMIGNTVFDFLLGLIPVIGDAGDFVFKANSRNWEILKKYTALEGEVVRSI